MKATWVVVGIVAAIAVAAGVDALRGEPERVAQPREETGTAPPPGSTTSAEQESPVPAPDGQPEGILYFTDAGCRLRATRMPPGDPVDAPNWDECRFVLSPDGERVSGAGSGWDPHADPRRGRLFQSDATTITVSTNAGPEGAPFKGSAPAWRPDGTLTYTDGRSVRAWPGRDVLLSQDDLAEAVRASPDVPDEAHVLPVAVRELAWLDNERAVVVLEGTIGAGPPQSILAFFGGRRLTAMHAGEGARFSDLRVSRLGTFVAVRSGDDDYLLLDARGDVLPAPTLRGYRAAAWSPDEQWVAIAADNGVSVFKPGNDNPPASRFDLDARDLAWRGTAGPPALASVDAARDWLTRAGMTGRLFVTLPGCRVRALRLPALTWEAEPDVRAPCRFTLDASGSVLSEEISAAPTGDLTATCEGPNLRVLQDGGFRASLRNACGPAWMGDGTLTFIRDGGLWQGVENARRLMSREQVGELFGRPSSLEEVAWVDDERFWAVVRSGETAIVALMTPESLVFSPSFTARAIEGLRVSATGMIAARTEQGVVVFDSGGRRAMTFPNGQTVAWAPGELIAAVATPTEVLFVAPVSREVVSLPLPVRDLEWVVP